MSWETSGGRPSKGMRRHRRLKKAALRRQRTLEMCANSASSKASRQRLRQAAERERLAEAERLRRRAQREADEERLWQQRTTFTPMFFWGGSNVY